MAFIIHSYLIDILICSFWFMDLYVYFSVLGTNPRAFPWLDKTSLTGFSHISVCIFYVKMPTFTREAEGIGKWDIILLVPFGVVVLAEDDWK